MKISFIKIIFVLVFGVFCFAPFMVSANSTHNMSGFAWSSNIGWISFNCTNTEGSTCTTYGVNKNLDGTLTGYAWSSNIGWIQFGNGLSGFPATGGNAQVDASGNLTGWAKAISGGDGSSGWDGWISLSGTGYGVTLSGTNFSGYAWGSEVVGWVSFSGTGYGVVVAPATTEMSGTLTASNCTIASGASTCASTLSWSINNTEAVPSAITSSGMADIVLSTPTIGNSYSGTKSYTFTSPASRTFYLYNNAKSLVPISPSGVGVIANATCVGGTSWDGTKCAVAAVTYTVTGTGGGAGGTITPATQTVISGNPATLSITPTPGYTASASGCGGLLGGTTYTTGAITANCTVTASFTVVGVSTCNNIPMKHYKCDGDLAVCDPGNPADHSCDTSTPASRVSRPTKWTWTCGITTTCSEKKSGQQGEN